MDKADDENIKIRSAKDLFDEFRNEINFTKSELNSNTSKLSGVLEIAINKLQVQIEALTQQVNHQDKISETIQEELSKLLLLPEKIKSRISMIAPEIAEEVGNIHIKKLTQLNDTFNIIIQNLNDLVNDQRDQSLGMIAQLAENAEFIASKNRNKLLKLFMLVILFSSTTSGITSYFVTHYFPTHVSITGASHLEVRDSNVHVRDRTVRSNEPQ